MENYGYKEIMDGVGAYLEIKWDLHNPIEVRDLGDSLKALADRYEEFSRVHFGASENDSRFYIQEIKKGSIIVEFVAASIGIMNNALILNQFYEMIKANMLGYVNGILPKNHKPESARDYANIVRAVANASNENSTISFAFREQKANGDHAVFALTKGDTNDLTTQVFANQPLPTREELSHYSETVPRRELMRLYQHNLDPTVANKKRTYHKTVIAKYDKDPKALLYENQAVADELTRIISELPYGEIIFDVSVVVCSENSKIKAYRLVEIHSFFEDEQPKQVDIFDI